MTWGLAVQESQLQVLMSAMVELGTLGNADHIMI